MCTQTMYTTYTLIHDTYTAQCTFFNTICFLVDLYIDLVRMWHWGLPRPRILLSPSIGTYRCTASNGCGQRCPGDMRCSGEKVNNLKRSTSSRNHLSSISIVTENEILLNCDCFLFQEYGEEVKLVVEHSEAVVNNKTVQHFILNPVIDSCWYVLIS